MRAQPGQAHQTRCLAVVPRLNDPALQQLLVNRIDVHAPEDLRAPGLGQHVIRVGGVQGVAQTVFHRLAKAKPVDSARAVFVDLCRCQFPPGKSALAEALDDLAQSRHDGVTLEVTDAARLVHPCVEAHPSSSGGGAIGPACYSHRGGQFTRCGGEAKASDGTVSLSAGRRR